MDNMKETVTQQICEACDCVITLSEPNDEIRYCFRCTEELNAFHDSQSITPEELEAWEDLWESQENQ